MKNFLKLLFLSLILTSLCSCDNNYDYSLYYSYKDNLKGIEVYCWDNGNAWYSGILMGTNRTKFIDEVQWLQDNLPCPLNKMRKILKDYSDEEVNNARIVVVSAPPLSKELNGMITEENIDEYTYVCEQLDIQFPNSQMKMNNMG